VRYKQLAFVVSRRLPEVAAIGTISLVLSTPDHLGRIRGQVLPAIQGHAGKTLAQQVGPIRRPVPVMLRYDERRLIGALHRAAVNSCKREMTQALSCAGGLVPAELSEALRGERKFPMPNKHESPVLRGHGCESLLSSKALDKLEEIPFCIPEVGPGGGIFLNPSPNVPDGEVLAANVSDGGRDCRRHNNNTRLDTRSIQSWINDTLQQYPHEP
jgi:hypothetical protein